MPCVGWILPGNLASRRVAERLGLINHGLRVDPSDGEARLSYTDRPLKDEYGGLVNPAL